MRSSLPAYVLSVAFFAASVACSPSPEPAAPAPVVDVEATVQARLAEERSRIATATPQPEVLTEAAAAARLIPSVVRVTTDEGMGSGVVVGDGLVITNRHVVGDRSSVTIQISSGDSLQGKVAVRNSILDVALLRVTGLKARAAILADVSRMKPGESVVAIGYPLDLKGDATVTRGLFSAARVGEPLPGEWVQTDASVNPGNSGGPLINLRGEVIGLITLRKAGEDLLPVQGINFALSANALREVLPAMLLAAGSMPPGAALLDDSTSADLARFLQQYDAAEATAFSKSDAAAVQQLSSPGLFSFVSSMIRAQKTLNIRRESTLVSFRLLAAYSLPGDLVVADVSERWSSRTYRGDKLLQDEGETDQPQVVVAKRVAGAWQLTGVQFKDADALGAGPTPVPASAPPRP